MRPIQTSLLTPGHVLARPVFNADGRVLLRHGVRLTTKYIQSLKKLGVSQIIIEDPRTDDIIIDDVLTEGTRAYAIKVISQLLVRVGAVDPRELKIKTRIYHDIATIIVDEIIATTKRFAVNISDTRTYENYTAAHSVNVAVLSTVLGISMGIPRNDLVLLAKGCLLHDIGKARIPPNILDKPGKLTEAEFKTMQNHALIGYTILENQNSIENNLVLIPSLEHHEKINGRGYPYHKTNKDINVFGKITAIADVFDALSSDRVYKKKMQMHMTMNVIRGAAGEHFDPFFVSAFEKTIPLFPPGTAVQLNSGEIAIVSKLKKKNINRPTLRLFYSKEGKYIDPPEEIDLEDSEKEILNVIDLDVYDRQSL